MIITNATIILPDTVVNNGTLVCRDGKIDAVIGRAATATVYDVLPQSPLPQDDEIIDAAGYYVAPGFIDIHTHGGGGADYMDNTVEAYLQAAATHACHGTTALLATTIAGSQEELFGSLKTYHQAKANSLNRNCSQFLGIHLEGPYFSYEQRGAQDPKYLRNPEPKEYEAILDASDEIVRWSLAPELPGALTMGRHLESRNILPAIAHSNATYEEVLKAFDVGFRHVTHLYSAMSTIVRRNSYRIAGVLEAAYLIDGMTVEIIADGKHLPKSLLQYVYKFKGAENTALCTDSMRAAGYDCTETCIGSLTNGQRVIIDDGVAKMPDKSCFAGSIATADRLVRTMVEIAETPIVDAVRMMTLTPAEIIECDDCKGAISQGMDADLVIFDEHINIQRTIIGGRTVYQRIKA